MANMELLDETVDWLRQHPERHVQTTWFDVDEDRFTNDGLTEDWQCGTTACLAGWTAIRDGWRPGIGSSYYVDKGDDCRPVDLVAQDLLDLTDEQASRLFYGTTSLEEVEEAVEDIRRGDL